MPMTQTSDVAKHSRLKLMSKEDIKAGQDNIRKNLVNLDLEIHANAVQCLLHAEKHGDTSLMRRLLLEIVDAKTGYRRQGLIAWMRTFSPMELKGDTITLSGTINGQKRPFQCEKANETPFYAAREFAEKPIRPVFQDTILSQFDRMVREVYAAVENTVNGQPVDKKKPFYDGIHADKIVDFIEKAKELRASIPDDSTAEVRKTQQRIAEDTAFVEAYKAS